MAVSLIIQNGKQSGKEIRISQHKKFIVGRGEDCNMCIVHDKVSRYHCALLIEEPSVTLRDLGSKSGTFVDGQRILSPIELVSGNVISVGGMQLEVRITTLNAAVRDSFSDAQEPRALSFKEPPEAFDLAGPAPRLPPPVWPQLGPDLLPLNETGQVDAKPGTA